MYENKLVNSAAQNGYYGEVELILAFKMKRENLKDPTTDRINRNVKVHTHKHTKFSYYDKKKAPICMYNRIEQR